MSAPQTVKGERPSTEMGTRLADALFYDGHGKAGTIADIIAIEAEAAAMERERLLAAVAEDDEASMCREELHTHGHGWCNGRAFVAILATP